MGDKAVKAIDDIARDHMADFNALLGDHGDEEFDGLPSGIKAVDNATGGFRKGTFNVIAARPANGKTAFAIHVLMAGVNFIATNRPTTNGKTNTILFFSLEMTEEELLFRMVSNLSGVGISKNRNKKKYDHDESEVLINAYYRIGEYKEHVHVSDQANLDINTILSIVKSKSTNYNISMVIIDYIGLVKAPTSNGRESFNRVAEITEITRKLTY